MDILGATHILKLVNALLALNHSLGFTELTQGTRQLLCTLFHVFETEWKDNLHSIQNSCYAVTGQQGKHLTVSL